MSSKHTNGPWIHVAVDGGWDGVAEAANRQSLICVLKHNNPANADLIAASPESHEANQLFVQAMNEMQGITAEHSDERIYDEMPSSQLAIAYFAARAAIAKATGGAQ